MPRWSDSFENFVHDDQGLAVGLFAGKGPVEDVFEEEGADLGGLVAVLGSARPG